VRILVLNQYFHPDRSATGQLLTELCEDLARHHEVWVVCGRPSYNPESGVPSRGFVSRERHRDVRVARVWSTSFDRSAMTGRLTNYASYVASSLVGATALPRPDIVVGLTDPPPIGLVAALLAKLRDVPFVLVTKDVFPEVAVRLGMLNNAAVIRALRMGARTLFRAATRVIVIGDDMRRRLRAAGVPNRKIELIHDWADGDLVRPLWGGSPLRARLGWEKRFVVMHSGNVGLSQDLETMIAAAGRLRAQEDVLFAIVGDGAAKEGLLREVRRRGLANIRFLPYQPKEALSDSLGAADVHLVGLRRGLAGYIVPSKVYGIMAAGRPFIAAVEEWSEPAIFAREHGCGVRTEPGDPEGLAQAILEMRDAPRDEMGKRGREAFERLYDRPIATEAYRDLLERVAEAGR
jgi:colanic acid biosynthesis glycosyl transferase WcaI